MQPLPKGVTGFGSLEAKVSAKHFAITCHNAARTLKGHIEKIRTAQEQYPANFHEATLKLRDRFGSVRILCNAQHPVVAFVEQSHNESDRLLRFTDCPKLVEALGIEYSFLTNSDASAAVSSQLIAELSEEEQAQLRYWKPRRIGDIIFNYWD